MTREEVKTNFENKDIIKTILSTSANDWTLALEVWIDTEDNSVVYAVTDGIEFCYGEYNNFNDAVDEYFDKKEKLEKR